MSVIAQFSQFAINGGIEIPYSTVAGAHNNIPIIPYNDPRSYSDPDQYDPEAGDPFYLVQVVLAGPANGVAELNRSSKDINVWTTPEGTGAILVHASILDSTPVTFNANGVAIVYVGWDASISSSSRDAVANTQATLSLALGEADRLHPVSRTFKRSETLLVGFAGHTQSASTNSVKDLRVDPSAGAFLLYSQAVKDRYNALLYPEDPGNLTKAYIGSDGKGGDLARDRIIRMVNYHGVRNINFYGYSHGGGTVHKVTQLLSNDRQTGAIGNFNLGWAAYIDAIDVDSKGDFPPELRAPVGASYFYNIFQSEGPRLSEPRGDAIASAININTDSPKNVGIWPNGTDHATKREGFLAAGNGIFEDVSVRVRLLKSLEDYIRIND